MKWFKPLDKNMLINVVDGLNSLVVLALSVELFNAWSNESENLTQISAFFFLASAAYRFIRAFIHRKDSRRDSIRDIISGGFLLTGMVLLLVAKNTSAIIATTGLLYFFAILTDRLFSVIRNHRPFNIILNILSIVALLILGHSMIAIVLVSIVQTMREIMRISFSQMKMDVLWRVIRKTNAAEILIGMLLMIIAFSLVLPMLEENIPDFYSALWYSFAIISTIGFGDVTAVSLLGRILSAILGLCGLMVVSLVMSIVVNFYNETKNMDGEE